MFRKYRAPQTGEFFIISADTAWGGNDYCATQFLSKTKLDVPIVFHERCLASEMTPLIHAEAEKIYDQTGVKPVVCFERNNGGIGELERLAQLNRLGKYTIYRQKSGVGTTDSTQNTIKLGWDTTSASRPTMLGDLKNAIDMRLFQIYDRPTINEMFSFIIKQGNTGGWKAIAESGAHDDLIMSLAIAWQLYQTESQPVAMQQLPSQDLFDNQGFY